MMNNRIYNEINSNSQGSITIDKDALKKMSDEQKKKEVEIMGRNTAKAVLEFVEKIEEAKKQIIAHECVTEFDINNPSHYMTFSAIALLSLMSMNAQMKNN